MSGCLLRELRCKKEVDGAIRDTVDKVVVLRFGRASDAVCLQLDDILARVQEKVAKMAVIFTVDLDAVPVYVKYFDITVHPATVFFFNQVHLKCDYGSQDHTKFIGAFFIKQDFIDLVETFFRGALRGKHIVQSPIDHARIPHYDIVYKGI
eukprot:TRINITY_DN6363_c0_g1_i5.p2 TRINITY_DN6363_c0_g1~~TRINITY_DN6363_c0_g1_i5.p2  ORF type:complete len:163 (+),score=48.48 TRINITY_DN6363_c0_g1_i5:38-490(+)